MQPAVESHVKMMKVSGSLGHDPDADVVLILAKKPSQNRRVMYAIHSMQERCWIKMNINALLFRSPKGGKAT